MKILNYKNGSFLKSIDSFLFNPINPYYITVLRLVLSAAIAVVFWHRSNLVYYLRTFPSLDSLYTEVFFTAPYSVIVYLFLIAFCIGYRPRITGLLLCVLLLPLVFVDSYRHSRQIILFSLLAFSLLPSTSQYNLLFYSKGKTLVNGAPYWPIRLIQFQLSFLYGVNAIAKTTPSYLSGDILQGMSIMLPDFILDLSSGMLELGPLVIPVFVLAVSSVLIEYILAIGFWFKKTRIPTAVLGIVFHISLIWVIKIGILDWASLFLYPAFLLPFDWKKKIELS